MVVESNLKVWAVATAAIVVSMGIIMLWWKAEPARSATTVPQGFTDSLVAQSQAG